MPRIKKQQTLKPYTVRLIPEQREYLDAKYGNISEALRYMTQGGPYEQAVKELFELASKLEQLNK